MQQKPLMTPNAPIVVRPSLTDEELAQVNAQLDRLLRKSVRPFWTPEDELALAEEHF